MTNLSQLTDADLSRLAAELQGREPIGDSWLTDDDAAENYTPATDIAQAMRLLESLPPNWEWRLSGPTFLCSGTGGYICTLIRPVVQGMDTAVSLGRESLARAITEAWVEAMENVKAREANDT